MLAVERQDSLRSSPTDLYVDLSFPVIGDILPADHGYARYAALKPIAQQNEIGEFA